MDGGSGGRGLQGLAWVADDGSSVRPIGFPTFGSSYWSVRRLNTFQLIYVELHSQILYLLGLHWEMYYLSSTLPNITISTIITTPPHQPTLYNPMQIYQPRDLQIQIRSKDMVTWEHLIGQLILPPDWSSHGLLIG